MRKNHYQFNSLLRTYNRYRRKLANLRKANKNERRQHILQSHIDRLFEKLSVLKMSIKMTTVAAGIAVGALTFVSQTADAQSFAAKQINPFGLSYSDGGRTAPTFADLDGDGDYDMLSGNNYYYYDYYTYTGEYRFKYYENIGSDSIPNFSSAQDNPFGITLTGNSEENAPTFVDLDSDGDMDILYGNRSGEFIYLENTGNSSSPSFNPPQTNPFGLTTIGYYGRSKPTFADLDNDGDLDLLSGNDYGFFYYFENTGDSASPLFGAPQLNPFGLTGMSYNYGNTAPSFVDIDGDGDFDVLSGDSDGNFFFFENTGDSITPIFAAYQQNPFNLTYVGDYNYTGRSTPTFIDLDADGDLDLMAGDSYGNFNFYKQCQPSTSTITVTSACSYTSPSGQLFTTGGTFIDVIPNATGCDSNITINLTIQPISDQTVSSANPLVCGSGSATIDLGSSQVGVDYYLRDNANDTVVSGPIMGTGSALSFNTGNITSPMTYNVFGKGVSPSMGLKFDGVDDYVDAGSGINLANTSFTIEFWAKKEVLSSGSDDHIIGLGDNTTANNALHIGFRGSNQFTFAFFGNDLDAPSNLADTDWHHWAVTYNKALSQKTIYRDGVVVASGFSASDFTGTGNLRIGRAYLATSNNPFQGNVDEVRVWSVSRTESEIQANMNTCLTGTETDLTAYYQFEDGAGATLTDLGAGSNNGTLTNMDTNTVWGVGSTVCSSCNMVMTQTITVAVDSVLDQTLGSTNSTICTFDSTTINLGSSEMGVKYYLRNNDDNSIVGGPLEGNGSSISFNSGSLANTTTFNVYAEKIALDAIDLPSTQDFIRFQTPFTTYGNAITVEAWVYSSDGTFPWAGQGTHAVDNMTTNVWLWHSGTWFVNDNGVWRSLVWPALPNGWVHVATIADAAGMRIYYNGVQVASNASGITSIIRNNASSVIELGHDVRFVAGTGGRNSNVAFDNFRVWNTAKTAGDIATNYNNCLTGAELGLVQYTKFNEGTGTTMASAVGSSAELFNATTNWIEGSSECAILTCSLEMSQTTTITVNTVDTTVDNTLMPTLSANQVGATYQWLDCNNGNAPIFGETNQTFTASVNGNYAVEVTINGCTDTSACEAVTGVGVKELANNTVSIYPNPTNGMVNINFGSNNTSVNYSITSVEGKVLETGRTSTNNIVVDLNKEGNGVYFIRISTESTSTVYKLIKQ